MGAGHWAAQLGEIPSPITQHHFALAGQSVLAPHGMISPASSPPSVGAAPESTVPVSGIAAAPSKLSRAGPASTVTTTSAAGVTSGAASDVTPAPTLNAVPPHPTAQSIDAATSTVTSESRMANR